ncbi:TetR/AcrR family transcriptional regulator [Cellulomonas soli]|uniref:TetR family transcriptional regulator n=1 Tax=Cellulomonas soli TaxID=931535 RepID=A0A512PGS4_9CELL|nr:TetR/AcrR family transcriptional regulator [Cellulomonas soli]NYI59606.1 AcrR family transcriptional regulator [Cellulomonas soli]GEP70400.1 TetR family transcriptional regulator [Cellulomonas soli]
MAGPRGEYRKSAERRAQILEAAHVVFARSGYTGSSVNEIARQVGMTQTGVLHHFAGGKVALLRAVLESRDHGAEDVLAGRTGRDFLAGLVEISRRQGEQRGMVQLYKVLAAEGTDPDHPAHDYFVERFSRITQAVTAAYQAIAADGGLVDGVDPGRAAIDTLAATEGLEVLWLNGLDVDMAADIERLISGFLTAPLGQHAATSGPATDPSQVADQAPVTRSRQPPDHVSGRVDGNSDSGVPQSGARAGP